jgi:hypothetical protein
MQNHVHVAIDTSSVCRFVAIGVDDSIAVSGLGFNLALGASVRRIQLRVVTKLAALPLRKVS